MAQNFNSPWVGALAADLTVSDGHGVGAQASAQPRWDLASPPADASWSLAPGDHWDVEDARVEDAPDGDRPAEAGAAARDVSVYQIGFTLLIGVGVAVGLSTAMLLR